MASTDHRAALAAPAPADREQHLRQQLGRIDALITGLQVRWLTKEWLGSPPRPELHYSHKHPHHGIADLTSSRIRLPEVQWRLIEDLLIAGLAVEVEEAAGNEDRLALLLGKASRRVLGLSIMASRDSEGELLIGTSAWADELWVLISYSQTLAPLEALVALPGLQVMRLQLHPKCMAWALPEEIESSTSLAIANLQERCADRLTQLDETPGTS